MRKLKLNEIQLRSIIKGIINEMGSNYRGYGRNHYSKADPAARGRGHDEAPVSKKTVVREASFKDAIESLYTGTAGGNSIDPKVTNHYNNRLPSENFPTSEDFVDSIRGITEILNINNPGYKLSLYNLYRESYEKFSGDINRLYSSNVEMMGYLRVFDEVMQHYFSLK